jgi:hypothetical protein
LVDVVNATSSGVLGLTMGCAQCHSHKFDPISLRDYYRFQGFFAKGQLLNLTLKQPDLWRQYEAAKKKDPKAPKPQTVGFYSPLSPTPVEVLPMEAVFPLPYQPDVLRRTEARLLVRGDLKSAGPAVGAGWPAVFGPPPDAEQLGRAPRTALVDWLVDRRNPLTARVWANRIWHYHFGRGLVERPGDFGLRGPRPSHPELLDWLADELVASGWSTKHLHRLIVLSSTYRQSSTFDPAGGTVDPDNRWLWRWQPRRLEAEVLRDAALAASGELDLAQGGPSIAKDQEVQNVRRSLYQRQDRNDFPQIQVFFDGPPASESCAQRPVSTVPLQPLFMLNNQFMVARAKALAARVAREAGADRQQQVVVAYRLALARGPDEQERAASEKFLGGATSLPPSPTVAQPLAVSPKLIHFCHALLNLNEFFYVE